MNLPTWLSWLENVLVRKGRSGSPVTPTEPSRRNPRRNAEFQPRKKHFLEYIDPSRTRGLEIGPLDLPMIEAHEGNCEFADYHSTDELRRMAAELDGTSPDLCRTSITSRRRDMAPFRRSMTGLPLATSSSTFRI
jgi:hypothetical protein